MFHGKFKMADGRHFENSIISISQPKIIGSGSNLVGRCRFQFPWWTFNKRLKCCKFKMADENRFWLYLGAILADQHEICNRNEGSHADIGHVTKTAIFANSRWRTAAILKIALSPYLRRELSDFDQIWYTDTNFHSEHANLTKKSKFFKFKMADGRHIENRFLAISRLRIGQFTQISEWRWRITCRYQSLDQHLVAYHCSHRQPIFMTYAASRLSPRTPGYATTVGLKPRNTYITM